jgi:hypothetical protein
MITFLEYQQIEEIYHYLIQKHELQMDSIAGTNSLVVKSTIQNISDLTNLSTDSIFETDDDQNIHLVDITSLNLNIKTKNQFTTTPKQIYLYNPDQKSLLAKDKKTLANLGIIYEKTKPITKQLIEKYLEDHIQKQGVTIPTNHVKKTIMISKSVYEAITIIDTIQHTNPEKYLSAIESPNTPELYMASFKPGNKSDILLWYKHTKEDELQLAISLIHTKLKKLNNAGTKNIKQVIELDFNIKTNNTITPMTWYKYFLYQALITSH